jgi:hypothetical protein
MHGSEQKFKEYILFDEKQREWDHLEDLDVDGRKLLNWTLNTCVKYLAYILKPCLRTAYY